MNPPEDEPSADVLLGLGANVGEPLRQLAEAVEALGGVIDVGRVSSVYRTEPVGFRDQPDFYNLVVAGRTALPPHGLLQAVLGIERRMGRGRTFRNAPRPIDIDLLAYGGLVLDSPSLVLPHPGIPQRGFVLHPLAEIAPEWCHPVMKQTARELLESLADPERVEKTGPLHPPA